MLEDRLKDDIISELNAFGGRVLLHTETADGAVIPVWEEVQPEDVAVLKDIMESRNDADSMTLQYHRIPITAEKPPDFTDLSEMIDVVLRTSMNTPIVVNCQLGGGRSTLASILLVLIRQWLESSLVSTPTAVNGRQLQRAYSTSYQDGIPIKMKQRLSYQVINSRFSYLNLPGSIAERIITRFPDLLRVVRKGPAVKNAVDDAIDQCSAVYNLRDSIDVLRVRSEEATDEAQKKMYAQKGMCPLCFR
jgi:hypothetical protein